MHLQSSAAWIHPTDGYDKSLTMDIPVREYWPENCDDPGRTVLSGALQPGCQARGSCPAGARGSEKPEAFMAAPLHASVTGGGNKDRNGKKSGERDTSLCDPPSGRAGKADR